MKHFGLKRIQSGCIEGKLMMLCGALTAIPMLTACFYPETLSDLAAFAEFADRWSCCLPEESAAG